MPDLWCNGFSDEKYSSHIWCQDSCTLYLTAIESNCPLVSPALNSKISQYSDTSRILKAFTHSSKSISQRLIHQFTTSSYFKDFSLIFSDFSPIELYLGYSKALHGWLVMIGMIMIKSISILVVALTTKGRAAPGIGWGAAAVIFRLVIIIIFIMIYHHYISIIIFIIIMWITISQYIWLGLDEVPPFTTRYCQIHP